MKNSTGSRTKSGKLKLLGEFSSNIVGAQYYDQGHRIDEQVYFDRNPANEYDSNAIEVRNMHGIIGHLKREQAAWLGPMIDEGRIYLKGITTDAGDNWRVPIKISVYMTGKGKSVFQKAEHDSPVQIIHNHLLDVFNHADNYSSGTLSTIREYYRGMMNMEGILPESRLIHKLLKNKIGGSRQNDLKNFVARAREYFTGITYGETLQHERLTVVPLFLKHEKNSPYISGKEALKNGTLIIEEIGDEGQVSCLRAKNTGNKPVILVNGEGLKGAKQDRVVNVTVIIDAGTEVKVPVSCVERGRWSYTDDNTFAPAHYASAGIRNCVKEDVHRNLAGNTGYDSDQDMVWHCVEEIALGYGVDSETDNLNEVYESMEENLKQVMSAMKYVSNASGIAVFIDDGHMSVDLFDHPALMKASWDEIVRSAAIEVINGSRSATGKSAERRKTGRRKRASKRERKETSDILAFFEQVCDNAVEPEQSPGKGNYIRSHAEGFEAGILIDGKRISHLSGFMA